MAFINITVNIMGTPAKYLVNTDHVVALEKNDYGGYTMILSTPFSNLLSNRIDVSHKDAMNIIEAGRKNTNQE